MLHCERDSTRLTAVAINRGMATVAIDAIADARMPLRFGFDAKPSAITRNTSTAHAAVQAGRMEAARIRAADARTAEEGITDSSLRHSRRVSATTAQAANAVAVHGGARPTPKYRLTPSVIASASAIDRRAARAFRQLREAAERKGDRDRLERREQRSNTKLRPDTERDDGDGDRGRRRKRAGGASSASGPRSRSTIGPTIQSAARRASRKA